MITHLPFTITHIYFIYLLLQFLKFWFCRMSESLFTDTLVVWTQNVMHTSGSFRLNNINICNDSSRSPWCWSQHLPQPHVHLHSLQNKHLNPEEEAQRFCVKFQSTLLLETESSNAKSSSCPFTFYLCCLPHQEYNYNVHLKNVMKIQWM